MRYRLIALASVLFLGTACSAAGSDTTAAPADSSPVAMWGFEGGFVTPIANVLRPPRLVVYGDGQVITDAARTLKISEAEVGETVASMNRFLTGQPATATPRPDAPMVADVPTTFLAVRGSDGTMHEVRVPSFEQVRTYYPKELGEAHDLMQTLAERAAAQGGDYSTGRIRVAALAADQTEGEVRPWPQGVPEPADSTDPVWTKDLDGEVASTLGKVTPAGIDQPPAFFKTPSGKTFVLSWRYLLPGE